MEPTPAPPTRQGGTSAQAAPCPALPPARWAGRAPAQPTPPPLHHLLLYSSGCPSPPKVKTCGAPSVFRLQPGAAVAHLSLFDLELTASEVEHQLPSAAFHCCPPRNLTAKLTDGCPPQVPCPSRLLCLHKRTERSLRQLWLSVPTSPTTPPGPSHPGRVPPP